MKNLLLFTIAILSMLMSFGQDEYVTWVNSADSKTELEISLNDENIYMDILSLKSGNQGLVLDESDRKSFVGQLQEAKEKYKKWSAVADSNKVTDLKKEIKSSVYHSYPGYFTYYSKWKFDYSVNLTFIFLITDGSKMLVMKVDKMIASDNEYMESGGGALIFESEKEIGMLQAYLNKGDIDKFRAEIKKKKQEEKDMFK